MRLFKFKAKNSEIIATPLIPYVGYMKKRESYGYVYDFSVDYDAIAVDDILDIHKYLMKMNGIV